MIENKGDDCNNAMMQYVPLYINTFLIFTSLEIHVNLIFSNYIAQIDHLYAEKGHHTKI